MKTNTASRSTFRKRAYYLGIGLVALGLLLLLAAALPVVENLDNLPAVRNAYRSIAVRGFSGSALILIGFVAVTIGSLETVGSGISVRPPNSLGEPDEGAVEERILPAAAAQSGERPPDNPPPSWRDQGLCCLDCRSINPSNARYCNQCGIQLPFRQRRTHGSLRSAVALGSA